MGVYIPPNSNSNGNGKDNSNGKSSSLGSGDNTFKFYTRPSVGLKIWGPLVPASDYLPGLYALTGLQTIMGLVMFKNVRSIWHNKTTFARFSKGLSTIAGAYLIFNSGLEVSRLTLPYDPWYDEAKAARKAAVSKGIKPNFWFGPWDFKPMSFKEWNDKVDQWILNTEEAFERGESPNLYEAPSPNGTTHNKFVISSPEFHNVYLQIRDINKKRHSQILEQLQNNSFNDILPNYQTHINPGLERSHVTLPPDNELKDDYDLEEAWEMNDPWVSLGHDTDYIVKFIPRFRWINNIEENRKRFQEQQDSLKSIREEHDVGSIEDKTNQGI